MANRPGVIIVVRHGARLDAADKSWHLTSPTPYDPPLTYGGWTQSRSLGLRIASLLHAREESASGEVPAEPHELTTKNGPPTIHGEASATRRGKRKHKIYVHSSPFQRCVQTSIGISAGISQFQGAVAARARNESRPTSAWEARPSPRLHAVDATAESVIAKGILRKTLREGVGKTRLRIDACLGEWLSPDYFDMITPPPNSTMMVAGAKVDLLRREGLDLYSTQSTKVAQGNLWSSNRSSIASNPQTPDEIVDMHQLSPALPGRDRTSSFNSGRVSPFGRSAVVRGSSAEPAPSLGYVPPVPGYAIAPVDTIPRGYVAHARDACVDIDYQWDSQREPLEWGDGGEYGEEWSAMHKRFRKGLIDMISFYTDHPDGEVIDDHVAVPSVQQPHDDSEPEEETVLIIVTHGAGCNALIGGLTEQPVLLDVGMASLTMTVRKTKVASSDTFSSAYETARRGSRSGIAITTGLSDLYDMKIVASSEHLRPGSDPSRPSTPNTSSPSFAAAKPIPESRRRSTLLSHANAGAPVESAWALGEHVRGNTSSALGSIRRLSGHSTNKTQRSNSTSSGTSMTGLWTPSTPPLTDVIRETEFLSLNDKNDSPSGSVILDSSKAPDDSSAVEDKLGISYDTSAKPQLTVPSVPMRSKSDDPGNIPRISMTSASPRREEAADSVGELPRVGPQAPASIGRTLSQKGLWGSAPSGIQERDRGPKRRWTLQQD